MQAKMNEWDLPMNCRGKPFPAMKTYEAMRKKDKSTQKFTKTASTQFSKTVSIAKVDNVRR